MNYEQNGGHIRQVLNNERFVVGDLLLAASSVLLLLLLQWGRHNRTQLADDLVVEPAAHGVQEDVDGVEVVGICAEHQVVQLERERCQRPVRLVAVFLRVQLLLLVAVSVRLVRLVTWR